MHFCFSPFVSGFWYIWINDKPVCHGRGGDHVELERTQTNEEEARAKCTHQKQSQVQAVLAATKFVDKRSKAGQSSSKESERFDIGRQRRLLLCSQ